MHAIGAIYYPVTHTSDAILLLDEKARFSSLATKLFLKGCLFLGKKEWLA